MFSDSWPNDARQWLPVIDHPSDKATGEFIVTAPNHYQVVSNGLLIEEIDLPDGQRRTHWRAVGANRLVAARAGRRAVHLASRRHASGASRSRRGCSRRTATAASRCSRTCRGERSRFFIDHVGPYSYEKLANVQAVGISGGMELASAIFYGEKDVAAGRAPVVHEIAHQWFGNAVTERDWDDVWLSEGFATYFALLFTEHDEGRDAFVDGLKRSREQVFGLTQKLPDAPIVHRNLDDMRRVLNGLIYQKGGWVLHMLRAEVGTEHFWTAIREYLPPLSEPERVNRRPARGVRAGVGQAARVVLHPVADAPGLAEDRRILALRPGQEAGGSHPHPVAGGRPVPADGGGRHRRDRRRHSARSSASR